MAVILELHWASSGSSLATGTFPLFPSLALLSSYLSPSLLLIVSVYYSCVLSLRLVVNVILQPLTPITPIADTLRDRTQPCKRALIVIDGSG